MAGNICWGVEVGAGALKAVKLERVGDDVNVLDFAIIPHKRPLSAPDSDEKEQRRLAVGALVSQFDLRGASLSLSMPGAQSFAKFAKLPPVEPKQVPDIVKFEAVQQIPFPIDEVEWDYQTFQSPDSPDVEVGIFAITSERVREKLAKWEDVGLTPDVLTLSSLAAYNALAYDLVFTERTPGTVILDVGTSSTDLVVAEGGRLWIRTFPIGGHQFTEALVTAFNLNYAKGERLKREVENTQHTREVLQAMRPVFGDLAQDVQRSIGYYQSTHREAKITRLIGLGSTFDLPGLKKFLSQQLQIEVGKLEGFQRIKMTGDRNAEFQKNAHQLTTAVGLALQGVGLQTIQANLMPIAITRDAMWNRKTGWFIAAGTVALMAGAASFVRPVLDSAAVPAQPPAHIAATAARADQFKKEWQRVESEYQPNFKAAAMMAALDDREVIPNLAADLGRLMSLAQQGHAKPDGADAPGDAAKAAAAAVRAEPRLELVAFDTAFSATLIPGRPIEGASTGADSSGFGSSERGGGPTPPAGAAPAEGAPTAVPHVRNTLTVRTTLPVDQADALMTKVVQAWLINNAGPERTEGSSKYTVPYKIVLPKEGTRVVAWVKTEEVEVPRELGAAGGAGGLGGETGPGSGGQGGRLPTAAELAARAEAEARARGLSVTNTGRPSGAGRFGGGQAGEGVGSGGGESSAGGGDLDRVAPIAALPPLGKPGDKILTYKVVFDAVLRPTAPKKEGGQ